ncbi:hypothetical protein ACFLW1_03095 [Chloroflexota bacterium]
MIVDDLSRDLPPATAGCCVPAMYVCQPVGLGLRARGAREEKPN